MSEIAFFVSVSRADANKYCDLTPLEKLGKAQFESLANKPKTRFWKRKVQACRPAATVATRRTLYRILFRHADLIQNQMRVLKSLKNSFERRSLLALQHPEPLELHETIYAAAVALDHWYQDNAALIYSEKLAGVKKHICMTKARNLLPDLGPDPGPFTSAHDVNGYWARVMDWCRLTFYYYQALLLSVSWMKDGVHFVALDCEIFIRANTTDRTSSAA